MFSFLLACPGPVDSADPEQPNFRYSHAGGLDESGRYLHVVGGSGLGGKESRNNAWRYDLDQGGWERLSDPPAYVFRASWARGGQSAWVHGGAGADNADTDQLLEWDLDTDLWRVVEPVGELPSPRFKEAASWAGDRVVVYGGRSTEGEPHNFGELWTFDPPTESWAELDHTDGPGALTRTALAWDEDRGRLWLQGGIDDENERHGWLWWVDLETGVWTQATADGEGPGKRASHTLALIQGSLYVWGGNAQDEDVWVFDPDAGTWTAISAEGPAGRDAQVTGVGDAGFVVFGGDPYSDELPDFTNDLWSFDTGSQTWTRLEPWSD